VPAVDVMSPFTWMKPDCTKPGLKSTFGVPQVSVQGSQVVPAGHERFATHVPGAGVGHNVVLAGQLTVPHWFAYVPPVGHEGLPEQDAPDVDDAAVQPPQGKEAVLQTQLSEAQLQFWFEAQGRPSFTQELSEAL
jgi:hypothetical protein